jgi:peptidoglycan hydrolase-like protein with peptidoglycan-binding domain
MTLGTGDKGEGVKQLQRDLNKLGAMLIVDGDFRSSTRDAVIDARAMLNAPGPPEADDALQAAIASHPDPFPPLTAAGVTFIARAEVSSGTAYRRKFQNPCCPPAPSGITIGIGYDCQFVTRPQFIADWQDMLPRDTIDRLVPVLGRVGTPALLAMVDDLVVPLFSAMSVFTKRTLPACMNDVRSIYPQVDQLPEARRTALASLVYNRGSRLKDRDERQDRREMRAIRDRLASGDAARIDGVADEFDAMTRLWDPEKAAGLIQRRHDEARLWREGFAALQLV